MISRIYSQLITAVVALLVIVSFTSRCSGVRIVGVPRAGESGPGCLYSALASRGTGIGLANSGEPERCRAAESRDFLKRSQRAKAQNQRQEAECSSDIPVGYTVGMDGQEEVVPIISPNFGYGDYPQSMCRWTIQAPLDKVVVAWMDYMDIESSTDCIYDYVGFYIGETFDDPTSRILKLCGSGKTTKHIIPASYVGVEFVADNVVFRHGFKLFYEAIDHSLSNANANVDKCQGRDSAQLVEVSSTPTKIFSPGYVTNGLPQYTDNLECFFLFQGDNEYLEFSIFHMDIEESTGCANDYAQIWDGESFSDETLVYGCGQLPVNALPLKSYTSGSSAIAGFVTNGEITATGIAMYVRAVSEADIDRPCGSPTLTLADGETTFKSPYYPQQYDHNMECTWTLEVAEGKGVKLNFEHFDLEYHEDCNNDYVEVWAPDTNGFLIDKLCGSTSDGQYILSGSAIVTVRFVSNAEVSSFGFSASFEEVDLIGEACETQTASYTPLSSLILSPLYPGSYGFYAAEICQFELRSPTDETQNIATTLVGNVPCNDSLQVNDISYCIEEPGLEESLPEVTSSSIAITLYMNGYATNDYGQVVIHQLTQLSALYEEPLPPECDGGIEFPMQEGVEVEITSPNHPDDYGNNLDCAWIFMGTPLKYVQITFTSFNVEESGSGCYDYVRVRDGTSDEAPFIDGAPLCGADIIPGPFTASQDAGLHVSLSSDGIYGRPGFHAVVTLVTEPGEAPPDTTCDNDPVTEQPPTSVATLYYPNNYPPNYCGHWLLVAASGQQVEVAFAAFDVEEHSACNYDSLNIYDGTSNSDTLIAKLCNGVSFPEKLKSTTGSLYLRFTSDNIGQYQGFSIQATEVEPQGIDTTICAETEMLDGSGAFQSPFSTELGTYPPNAECQYVITVESGMLVRLTFNSFELEKGFGTSCLYDYVKLYNGGVAEGDAYRTLCGTLSEETVIYGTGNQMTVVFRSDESIEYAGFEALYASVDPADLPWLRCGRPLFEGLPEGTSSRIVGGSDMPECSVPWQVGLVTAGSDSNLPWCGGTLVSSRYVITAEHCVVHAANSPGDVEVILGMTNVADPENSFIRVGVDNVMLHPDVDDPYAHSNDIALIHLDRDIEYNNCIMAACAPTLELTEGTECVVTGWGDTASGGDQSFQLQAVSIDVISHDDCNTAPSAYAGLISPDMVCAGNFSHGGIDSCQGDSGGPVVRNVGGEGEDAVYQLVGVVSWGYGCAEPQKPGVYQDVYDQLPWLMSASNGEIFQTIDP